MVMVGVSGGVACRTLPVMRPTDTTRTERGTTEGRWRRMCSAGVSAASHRMKRSSYFLTSRSDSRADRPGRSS